MASKFCRKCEKTFDVSAFYPHTSAKDGLHPWCKGCHRAYSRRRYHNPATTDAPPRPLTRRGRPRKPDPQPS